jgi:arylamine N-acetyltransferase
MQTQDFGDVARDFLRLAGIAPAKPDLAYLAKLARAFSILPYENLTKIVRAGEIADPEHKPRMPDVVFSDHLDLGAGGTCFSLTHFFRTVLAFAGYYDAQPVMCDRSYGPDTHCALIVKLGSERYLVDPGYLMEEPLLVPRQGESVQKGKSSTVRLQRLGQTSQLILITERDGKRRIRYRLKESVVSDERFRSFWIDSFDWAMMRHLCVSRQTPEGQIFMRDGMMRLVGGARKQQDRIGAGFAGELERAFGIHPRITMRAEDAVMQMRKRYTATK